MVGGARIGTSSPARQRRGRSPRSGAVGGPRGVAAGRGTDAAARGGRAARGRGRAMNETVSTTGVGPNRRRRGMPVPKGGRVASQVAACVLEVLAGVRTPAEAAGELGVSLPRYYQLEQRALQGLVQGCE